VDNCSNTSFSYVHYLNTTPFVAFKWLITKLLPSKASIRAKN